MFPIVQVAGGKTPTECFFSGTPDKAKVKSTIYTNIGKLQEGRDVRLFCYFYHPIINMETVIKIHPSELNSTLLNKIKKFIGDKENVDVTISLKEFDPAYEDALDRSIDQAESGQELITMTMEEFVAYTPKKKQ